MSKDTVVKKSQKDWAEYYKITKNKPPSKLLIKALKYVKNKKRAIDIGGGALKDTRYLLSKGFDVTVIDSSELMAKEAKKIKSGKLRYVIEHFDKFNFPENTFDIALTMYSLPFNAPDTFDNVFENIKKSIVEDGIFCGQLFGVRDEWSNKPNMTFHTKRQIAKLFLGMEIIYFKEEEIDGKTANGAPKHWHVFHFIAKRII